MFCAMCGKQQVDNARFCRSCGADLTESTSPGDAAVAKCAHRPFNDSDGFCSACGSSDSVEVRFAACVATSEWGKNNYPAPNTEVTTRDDIRLWRIPLCRTCIPSGYRWFLRNRVKRMRIVTCVSSFPLIFGVLFIYFLADNSLLFALSAVTIAIGVVGMAVGTVNWIGNFRRLKGLERRGVVPEMQIDKSFVGEGQRIIKALVPDGLQSTWLVGHGEALGKVWGEFSLPEHKTFGEIEVTPEVKKRLFPKPKRDRDIVAVGKTINEMERQLPSQWKSLWEQRRKNRP